MVAEVQMPALSPTMTEGKIVSWNKKEGDVLAVGDVILEVETDKAVMEVESQNKGILGKILYNENETVSVGTIIALILEKGENKDILKDFNVSVKDEKNNTTNISSSCKNQDSENNNTGENNFDLNKKNTIDDGSNNAFAYQVADDRNQNLKAEEGKSVFASPLAKKIAKLNNINISNIHGSGPCGRIVKADVEALLTGGNTCCIKKCVGRNSVEFVDIEPSGMRCTVASRLSESKRQVPHWYLKIKVDMTNLLALKEDVNGMAKVDDGKPEFKVSVNDIIVMAVSRALQRNPKINSSWVNGKVRTYNNVDISVAVAVGDGIFTPIVKNADQMGLLDISSEIKRLAKKAKDGKLLPQEFQGGSVTISNLGMYGVQEFYSIINQPQSCIIAVGAVEKTAVVIDDGTIVARKTCIITLSADHRVIDGAVLAPFASDLKKALENPAIMMI